jgi:hypothetical protein
MQIKQPKQPDGPSPEAVTEKPEYPTEWLAQRAAELAAYPLLMRQLRNGTLPPDHVYVGRNRSLGGGLITDGVHWGNPFKVELPPGIKPFVPLANFIRSLRAHRKRQRRNTSFDGTSITGC